MLAGVVWDPERSARACDLSHEPIIEKKVLTQGASSPHMCNCKDHTRARTKAYSCWQVLSGILIKVIRACDLSHEPITEVPALTRVAFSPHMCNCETALGGCGATCPAGSHELHQSLRLKECRRHHTHTGPERHSRPEPPLLVYAPQRLAPAAIQFLSQPSLAPCM